MIITSYCVHRVTTVFVCELLCLGKLKAIVWKKQDSWGLNSRFWKTYYAVLHVMKENRSTEMVLFFKSYLILMNYQITIWTALFPPVLVTLSVKNLVGESVFSLWGDDSVTVVCEFVNWVRTHSLNDRSLQCAAAGASGWCQWLNVYCCSHHLNVSASPCIILPCSESWFGWLWLFSTCLNIHDY